MGKIYEDAREVLQPLAENLIDKYHQNLNRHGVRIDYLFAFSDTGHAITHGGYPALGMCKVVNLQNRALRRGDVEIHIDQTAFKDMSPAQRNALLDHELEHIDLVFDKEGVLKTDDLGRPKIKMKKHNFQFGWFTSIADRHRENSPEVFQAKLLWDEAGQSYFPMLTEAKP